MPRSAASALPALRAAVRLLAVWLPLLSSAVGRCAEPGAEGIEFFEKKIRPVLATRCYECHSATAKELKGGLLADSREGMLKGGESGPAIIPGKVDESLLIQAIRYGEDSYQMPPSGKLPAAVIADFEQWVKMDSPDPRVAGDAPAAKSQVDIEAGRKFWSFQPPAKKPLPAVRDAGWPHGDIDRFVLARLEAAGLKPVADADRRTLLRRAKFDLVGLPPTPEEIASFLADDSPDALARLLDRFLASPQFGERWGRYWLDLVRYADSNGGGINFTFDSAWRYRDYVIRALNSDKPYDEFVREQIAGDLLPGGDVGQQADRITATVFLMLGPKELADYDKPKLRMDVIDEQIDTTGRVFLGLTLGCARCHDHKFDPIPTTDYYALAGIFHSTVTLRGTMADNMLYSAWLVRRLPLPVKPQQEQALAAHAEAVKNLRSKLRAQQAELKKLEEQLAQAGVSVAAAPATAGQATSTAAAKEQPAARPDEQMNARMSALRADVAQLDARFKELKNSPPPPLPEVMAVTEEEQPEDVAVRIRGQVSNLGPCVPRGFVRVALLGDPPRIGPKESGRAQLAAWLASSRNPLTARVMVNRVWSHLLGEGLVLSVDNFGVRGELPSHPELLDYLAIRFMEENWSVKKLVREIMLARVYRLSTARDEADYARDAENRLLWRRNRHRLDADAIRDALLDISGRLDLEQGGPTLPYQGLLFSTDLYGKTSYAAPWNRRSVYLPILRGGLPEEAALLEVFDFPNPNLVTGKRSTTNVPTQSLYLMNSPFVMDQSRAFAAALLARRELDDSGRVKFATLKSLGRDATKAEIEQALAFVEEYRRAEESGAQGASASAAAEALRLEAWSGFCQALLTSNEFLFLN